MKSTISRGAIKAAAVRARGRGAGTDRRYFNALSNSLDRGRCGLPGRMIDGYVLIAPVEAPRVLRTDLALPAHRRPRSGMASDAIPPVLALAASTRAGDASRAPWLSGARTRKAQNGDHFLEPA